MRTTDGILVLVVALGAGLLVWIWFWPARWWNWLEEHPSTRIWAFAQIRSLPALGLCGVAMPAGILWLLTIVDPADANRRGPLTAQFFLFAAPVFSPWLLYVMVLAFGWPAFLLPPGARRRETDRAERRWAANHPVRYGLSILAGGGIALTTQSLVHGYWTLAAVGTAITTAAFWLLSQGGS